MNRDAKLSCGTNGLYNLWSFGRVNVRFAYNSGAFYEFTVFLFEFIPFFFLIFLFEEGVEFKTLILKI